MCAFVGKRESAFPAELPNLSRLNEAIIHRELIGNLIKDHNWAKLQEPCPECDIENAEKYVGFTFPEALKALLRETNGDHWFLLSAQEMIAHVKTNREIYPEYLGPDEFEEKVNRYH